MVQIRLPVVRLGSIDHSLMRTWIFAIALCFALSSCGFVHLGGMGPIERQPKISSIDLLAPVILKGSMGGGQYYPVDLYTPFSQNGDGTFYHAQKRPHTLDIAKWLEREFEGGLYLRDDMENGLHYWNKGGEIVTIVPFERLKVTPQYRYHERE